MEAYSRGVGLRVVTGSCYLGGFIVDQAEETVWIEGVFQVWAVSVEVLAGVAHRHPYTSYASLQKSPQQEWDFVQQVTPGIREAFCPVEEALYKSFLVDLFHSATTSILERGVTYLPFKQDVIAIPIPNLSTSYKCTDSCVFMKHLALAL